MNVSFSNAAQAYANAAKAINPGGQPQAGKASPGGSFMEALQGAAENALQTTKAGETTSVTAVTGRADLADVVTAVTNAEVTLQTVVAVRDRVIQAYQDILKMPI